MRSKKESLKKQALHVLRSACVDDGIRASLVNLDNYEAIFTRDAVMSGIAGLLVEDGIVIGGLKHTLERLRELQGPQGQIASNYLYRNNTLVNVSFGTLSPKLDSCSWYLIGVALLVKKNIVTTSDFEASVVKVMELLNGIEYNDKHLMYIPQGGNWADEYIYHGYILSDQVLRCWALDLVSESFGIAAAKIKSQQILSTINQTYLKPHSPFYAASVFPGGEFEYFDLAAHAILGMIAHAKGDQYIRTLEWINGRFMKRDILPPCFYPTISKDDKGWQELKKFHLFDFKNEPNHYHNGGIWIIWLGWLGLSLKKNGQTEALRKLLELYDDLVESEPDFRFSEYFTSDDLKPGGTEWLCYTASGILMLEHLRSNGDLSILSAERSFIKEPLELKSEYFNISKNVVTILEAEGYLDKPKLVVGISGESGSGKSVTARCLQLQLSGCGYNTMVLHQDSYYWLPPTENLQKRKSDRKWIGPGEVKLRLIQDHIDQFRQGNHQIDVPVLDYEKDTFVNMPVHLEGVQVLIVEGVYAFMLEDLDFRIFLERNYIETKEKRSQRSREAYDPFNESVLAIEHELVSPLKAKADILIDKSYQVERTQSMG